MVKEYPFAGYWRLRGEVFRWDYSLTPVQIDSTGVVSSAITMFVFSPHLEFMQDADNWETGY